MIKRFLLILLSGLLVSCKQKVSISDIQKVNGYWEIEKVETKSGEDKQYSINETVDYFELKKEVSKKDTIWNGFRQKLMPQFNGTFQTNGIKEFVTIAKTKDSLFVNYSSSYGKYIEELVTVEDSILILRNKDLIYKYKRYKPFSIK